MKFDMPTNEGGLALARSVATGAKLVIRGAALCNVTTGMGSVEEVANLTWSDISSTALEGIVVPCTSYLPSMYDSQGAETGSPVAALDLEFTYMPTDTTTYNVVAVLADMYYALMPFKIGNNYKVGDVVWFVDSTGNSSHYRCIADIENSNIPGYDTDHWETVTVVNTLEQRYGGLEYSTITSEPILLYVSKTIGSVTIGPEMEIDYKVRIYLDGVKNSASVKDYIVFDTLGLEFNSTLQLDMLAQFATQLQRIRDVAITKAARG